MIGPSPKDVENTVPKGHAVFARFRNCRNYGNLNNRRLTKLSLPRNKIETHTAPYLFHVYIIMIQYLYVF